jgi:hypothetical protein
MKISQKQAVMMFRILEGTLSIYDRSDLNMFGFDIETRIRLYNEILNQQSTICQAIKSNSK